MRIDESCSLLGSSAQNTFWCWKLPRQDYLLELRWFSDQALENQHEQRMDRRRDAPSVVRQR